MTKFSDNPSPSLLMQEHVDPSNPASGYQRLFVDTDHLFKMVDSAGTVTTFGQGLTDPMTTRGDIIIRNASNVTARLGRGSAGQVLQSDGTDIAWQTPSGGGPTIIRGRVAANGTITSGTGFTITKGGTGLYQINYSSAFTNPPLVLISVPKTDNSSYTAAPMWLAGTSADSASATGVYVREFASATGRDQPWMFLAMEIV